MNKVKFQQPTRKMPTSLATTTAGVFNWNASNDPTAIDEIDQKPQANPALGITLNMKEAKP